MVHCSPHLSTAVKKKKSIKVQIISKRTCKCQVLNVEKCPMCCTPVYSCVNVTYGIFLQLPKKQRHYDMLNLLKTYFQLDLLHLLATLVWLHILTV